MPLKPKRGISLKIVHILRKKRFDSVLFMRVKKEFNGDRNESVFVENIFIVLNL